MDPALVAVIAFALGGLFNAVVGAFAAEFQASRNHHRELERLRFGRSMDTRLEDLAVTDWWFDRRLIYGVEVITGAPGFTDKVFSGRPRPAGNVNIRLVDADTYRRVLKYEAVAIERSGVGMSPEDDLRYRKLSLDLGIVIERQRQRLMAGQAVTLIPEDEMNRLIETEPAHNYGRPPSGSDIARNPHLVGLDVTPEQRTGN